MIALSGLSELALSAAGLHVIVGLGSAEGTGEVRDCLCGMNPTSPTLEGSPPRLYVQQLGTLP